MSDLCSTIFQIPIERRPLRLRKREANRWLRGEKGARRPPDLSTRDVVARAIVREVKEGLASRHDGVFLQIASKVDAETIRRKLPSMYHQFKELADVDITREPMEVGPTVHYTMGGVRVDAETTAGTVPGLFAAGGAAGQTAAGIESPGWQLAERLARFGLRAGLAAAEYAKGITTRLKCSDQGQGEGSRARDARALRARHG